DKYDHYEQHHHRRHSRKSSHDKGSTRKRKRTGKVKKKKEKGAEKQFLSGTFFFGKTNASALQTATLAPLSKKKRNIDTVLAPVPSLPVSLHLSRLFPSLAPVPSQIPVSPRLSLFFAVLFVLFPRLGYNLWVSEMTSKENGGHCTITDLKGKW